jgi:hypothetical protein
VKDQGNFERLSIARRHRDVFTQALTIRLRFEDVQSLQELSDMTGRTVSDLVRAGIDLAIAAGQRVQPWTREKAWELQGKRPQDSPALTSDNIPYV